MNKNREGKNIQDNIFILNYIDNHIKYKWSKENQMKDRVC